MAKTPSKRGSGRGKTSTGKSGSDKHGPDKHGSGKAGPKTGGGKTSAPPRGGQARNKPARPPWMPESMATKPASRPAPSGKRRPGPGGYEDPQAAREAGRYEIGRASCRERVFVGV